MSFGPQYRMWRAGIDVSGLIQRESRPKDIERGATASGAAGT
jgi:hypothetical protein